MGGQQAEVERAYNLLRKPHIPIGIATNEEKDLIARLH